MEFGNEDGSPWTQDEVEEAVDNGEVFFCDVHIEWSEGAFCSLCSDGICEGCQTEIVLGRAGLRDGQSVWCQACVDNDIREPEARAEPGAPLPALEPIKAATHGGK